MRQLGFITNIEKDSDEQNIKSIMINIWDSKSSKILTKYPTNFDKSYQYELLHIIEYDEDNNLIQPLSNLEISKEENYQLIEIFKIIIENPKLSKVFLEQLDPLFNENKTKNSKKH